MDLYNSTDKWVGKPGDILITVFDKTNSDINAITMGSLTTHAAFVDSDPTKVLELFQDGIGNRVNDWRTRYKKILVVRPKVEPKIITDAIAYGHTKIGTPFSYFSNIFNKTKIDKYYCSQFVWDCYFKSGVDLDGNGGKAVFPYDFLRSDKVSIVYKQG
ncbi:YiiX/YebB-like N1pC/P60 family cysteine hydrolase [Ruminiclostridium josui]|nr:YiiX/YebB-like N1pC/P60 family cysteine hydrolase [Ruminiclostridium josui]